MEIFTIIIFGFATARTITPFWTRTEEVFRNFFNFSLQIVMATTMLLCYVWFLHNI